MLTTATVPLIKGWMLQKYRNSPSSLNVKLKDCLFCRTSLFHTPVSPPGAPDVVVCTLPVVVQFTVSPGWMVTSAGENVKLPVMFTWWVVLVGGGSCVAVGTGVGLGAVVTAGTGVKVGRGVSVGRGALVGVGSRVGSGVGVGAGSMASGSSVGVGSGAVVTVGAVVGVAGGVGVGSGVGSGVAVAGDSGVGVVVGSGVGVVVGSGAEVGTAGGNVAALGTLAVGLGVGVAASPQAAASRVPAMTNPNSSFLIRYHLYLRAYLGTLRPKRAGGFPQPIVDSSLRGYGNRRLHLDRVDLAIVGEHTRGVEAPLEGALVKKDMTAPDPAQLGGCSSGPGAGGMGVSPDVSPHHRRSGGDGQVLKGVVYDGRCDGRY